MSEHLVANTIQDISQLQPESAQLINSSLDQQPVPHCSSVFEKLRRWGSAVAGLAALAVAASLSPIVKPGPAYGAETKTVAVGAPFEGNWGWPNVINPPYDDNNSSHPSVHQTPAGGDWATDFYAAAGKDVKLKANSSGNLSLSWGTASGSCGESRRINMSVDGTQVGWMYITHLEDAAPTDEAPTVGMTIGKIANLGCNPGGSTGKHVHIEFRSAHNYSCYADNGKAGTQISEGASLGILGSPNDGPKQVCDDGGSGSGGTENTGANDILQATGITGIGWRLSYDATSGWVPGKPSTTTRNDLLVGDFDGDGRDDDIFQAGGRGVGWRVSMDGIKPWKSLKGSSTRADTLFIGDFDNDGHNDDVMQAGGRNVGWRVSYNGTSGWKQLNNSSTMKSTLMLGDFDGDGRRNDVFQASGVSGVGWRVKYDGKGAWVPLKGSTTRKQDLIIGDFDRDGHEDDVMQASGISGIGWRMVRGGKGGWEPLKNSTTRRSELMVGDFDGDGFRDDILRASGITAVGWQVAYGARGGWVPRKNSTTTPDTLLVVG